MLVRENVDNFTRGGDPYRKLNIGKYDDNFTEKDLGLGDAIELKEDLYYITQNDTSYHPFAKEQLQKLIDDIEAGDHAGDIYVMKVNEYGRAIWENIKDETVYLKTDWVINNLHLFKKIRNV